MRDSPLNCLITQTGSHMISLYFLAKKGKLTLFVVKDVLKVNLLGLGDVKIICYVHFNLNTSCSSWENSTIIVIQKNKPPGTSLHLYLVSWLLSHSHSVYCSTMSTIARNIWENLTFILYETAALLNMISTHWQILLLFDLEWHHPTSEPMPLNMFCFCSAFDLLITDDLAQLQFPVHLQLWMLIQSCSGSADYKLYFGFMVF